MEKLFFVFNPHSGKAKVNTALPKILQIFDEAGYEVTLRPTHAKGDATRLIREYADRYDRLVIGGGDGTLNEALQGLVAAKAEGKTPAPLGYLPAGSTNDFASSLGIPSNLSKAAAVAAQGEVFLCDAGSFNGSPFVYVAAFGAFTEVSYATPQQIKNVLGHLAYVLEGIKSLPQIKGIPLTVTADGETFSDRYLYGMVSNTTSVGGVSKFYEKQKVELDDGLLETILVREPRTLAEKTELISALLRMDLSSDFFRVFKTPAASFVSPEPIGWTTDGEFGGNVTDAQIKALPHAYRILIPATEKQN